MKPEDKVIEQARITLAMVDSGVVMTEAVVSGLREALRQLDKEYG